LRELPKECAITVVVDPHYDVLDLLDDLRNREIFKIPIGSVPLDVREFLEETRVSLVVTAHDASLIGALFLLAARDIGIASVYVPHGPLSAARGKITALKLIAVHVNDILTYAARYVASGCLARAARIWASKFVSGRAIDRLWDVACVAGPATKTLFLRSGIPEDAIVVTGQPRYDSFVNTGTRKEKNSIFEHLGLDKGTPVVVVATQPFVEDGLWTAAQRARFLELVVAGVLKAGGQPLIKLHPRETGVTVYRSLLSTLTDAQVAIVKDEIDLATVLTACDALLTVRSTIGLEAMMLGLPVIAFEEGATGKTDALGYVQYGAAVGVYSEKELAPSIAAVLFDPRTRAGLAEASERYVYDHAYLQDGLYCGHVPLWCFTFTCNEAWRIHDFI
jgi:glycosyltransferase involved in cell wall biosynthesis